MKARSIILVFFLTSMFGINLCLAQNDSAKVELNNWKHKISLGTNLFPFWPRISDELNLIKASSYYPILEYERKLTDKSSLRGFLSFRVSTDTNGQFVPFPQTRVVQLRRSYLGVLYERDLFNIKSRTTFYGFAGIMWIHLTSDTTFTANIFRRGPSWSTSFAGDIGLGVEYSISKRFSVSMEGDFIAIYGRRGRTYYRAYPPPPTLVTEKSKFSYADAGMFRIFGLKVSYRF